MKINIRRLLVTLCIIFMFRPYYVQIQPKVNNIWAFTTVLLALVCSFVAFNYKTINFEQDKFFLAFICIYLIGTFFNVRDNIYSAISCVGQVMLAYCLGALFKNAKYRKHIIQVIPLIISIYIYIDFLTIVLKTSSKFLELENTISFLGYDNYSAFYIIPFLAVKLQLDYLKKGRLDLEDYIFLSVCIIGKLITKSYAALLALMIFVLLSYCFRKKVSFRKLFNIKNAVLLIFLIFIGVYYFNIQIIFAALLNRLGKGVTLSARTVIWNIVMRNLKKVPFWGLGYINDTDFRSFFGFPYGYTASHCHFLFLDLIVQAGLLGLIFYLSMLTRINIKKINDYNCIYLFAGLISFIFLSFFDSYPFVSAVYLLISMLIRDYDVV